MTDPRSNQELVQRVEELDAKATKGPWRSAGGYVTVRDPNGSSFTSSIYDLDEMGQWTYRSAFQAVPFARKEDAAIVAESRTLLLLLASRLKEAGTENQALRECSRQDDELVDALTAERDALEEKLDAWVGRFMAIMGASSPDSAGNAVLTMESDSNRLIIENRRLTEENERSKQRLASIEETASSPSFAQHLIDRVDRMIGSPIPADETPQLLLDLATSLVEARRKITVLNIVPNEIHDALVRERGELKILTAIVERVRKLPERFSRAGFGPLVSGVGYDRRYADGYNAAIVMCREAVTSALTLDTETGKP